MKEKRVGGIPKEERIAGRNIGSGRVGGRR
jgi:hypothetical protein